MDECPNIYIKWLSIGQSKFPLIVSNIKTLKTGILVIHDTSTGIFYHNNSSRHLPYNKRITPYNPVLSDYYDGKYCWGIVSHLGVHSYLD